MLNDNFYVLLDKEIKGKSRNSRIKTIIEDLSINDRCTNATLDNVSALNKINRNLINQRLSIRQKESADFLSLSLK